MDKLWISLSAILVGLCVPTRAVGVYNLKTTLTGDSEDTLQKWVTSGSQSGARIGVHPTFSSAMNLPKQALWCGNGQSEYNKVLRHITLPKQSTLNKVNFTFDFFAYSTFA